MSGFGGRHGKETSWRTSRWTSSPYIHTIYKVDKYFSVMTCDETLL